MRNQPYVMRDPTAEISPILKGLVCFVAGNQPILVRHQKR